MFKKLRHVFYGWWIVVASFFLFLVAGGTALYGFTAFFNPISSEMRWSRAETSFGFSLRSVEGGIVQPFIGFFVDRVGIRNCILAGLALLGVALFLISHVSTLAAFYIGFVVLSVGYTLATGTPEYAAVANWFQKRRSLAMGLTSAGFGISGIMAPIFIVMIHSFGWRETLMILSPSVLIICVPMALLIKDRPAKHGRHDDGIVPENSLVAKSAGGASPAVSSRRLAEGGLSVKQCLATKTFWLLLIYCFFISFSSGAIQVLEIPHLVAAGISDGLAAFTMTGITVGSLIGRLGFSWLGDIYSKKNLLIISALMQAVGIYIFAIIDSPWMIILFLVFYAPGYGGPIPLVPAIQADYFGTKAFASIRGLISIGFAVPGILGPFFAGYLFDIQKTYSTAFIIYAVLTLFAVPAIWMATLSRGNTASGKTGGME